MAKHTHYTKIGETHVTQGIKSRKAVVGGEGNGGVIFPKVGWGRDSLTGIVIALKYLADSGKTVSEIVKDYPTYVMHRAKKEVANRDEVSKLWLNLMRNTLLPKKTLKMV